MPGSVASGTPCIIRVPKILIEGLSRVEPWKRTTYFGSTYHISTPHPTFSISLSFMRCSHISVFFSPLKKICFSPYFSTLLHKSFFPYYILTPISSLTAIYSYTFSRVSLAHSKPQISFSVSFFIPHKTSVEETYFSENPRAIKQSNEHNSLQRLEF
jgi:hypothetical protein